MEATTPEPADTTVAAVLDAVRQGMLELAARSTRPPASLRVSAGGVSIEAEWATAVGASVEDGPARSPDAADDAEADDRRYARSPTAGAFYRAPGPGAPPFVEIGEWVDAGRQLGVVESMKLFFPVEADVPGRVIEVLKDDGAAVDLDEPVVALGAS